jgi:ribosomal protein L40E
MHTNPYSSSNVQVRPKQNRLIISGVVFLVLALACSLFTGAAYLMGWYPTPEPEGFEMFIHQVAVFSVFSPDTPPRLIIPFGLMGLLLVGTGIWNRRIPVQSNQSSAADDCLKCGASIPDDAEKCPSCGWSWD